MHPILLSIALLAGNSTQQTHSIRHVDLSNFVFPILGGCEGEPPGGCPVRFVNGRRTASLLPAGQDHIGLAFTARLDSVLYGDVTGDGAEEALMLMRWNLGGTGQFSQLFVYSLRDDKPVLLDRLPLGDRAQGGYLDFCILHGLLVVVRFRGDGAIGVDGVEDTTYAWRDGRFATASRVAELWDENEKGCDSFWQDCRKYRFDSLGQPIDFVTACGKQPFNRARVPP